MSGLPVPLLVPSSPQSSPRKPRCLVSQPPSSNLAEVPSRDRTQVNGLLVPPDSNPSPQPHSQSLLEQLGNPGVPGSQPLLFPLHPFCLTWNSFSSSPGLGHTRHCRKAWRGPTGEAMAGVGEALGLPGQMDRPVDAQHSDEEVLLPALLGWARAWPGSLPGGREPWCQGGGGGGCHSPPPHQAAPP